MKKIVDFMKGIIDGVTSKQIVFGLGVWLIALFMVLVSVMLFGSATESIGNLLGIQDNKTKTIQFIGWAIGGVFFAIVLASLSQWAESQVEHDSLIEKGHTQERFKIAAKYIKKIVDFLKRIIDGITSKQIISGLGILLIVLFVVLVSVIFFDGAATWIGNLFRAKNNKTETIQFIGWGMGGVLKIIGLVILWRARDRVKHVISIGGGYTKELFKIAMKHVGKIVNFLKRIIKGITSEQIVLGLATSLFVVLFVVFVSDIFFNNMIVWNLIGADKKRETIDLLGWAMSGVLAVIGVVVLNRRAKAQLENNKLVEKGHTQERFKTATEHLGHKDASVRIAAFYEFVHLANDNKKEYLKNILTILYAHIRTTTTNAEYVKEVPESDEAKPASGEVKPTEEIQGLLDGLFKFKEIDRGNIDIKPNLQRVYFSGADLISGDLSGADLRKANLSKAKLSKAIFTGARLVRANLIEAGLFKADLTGVNLSSADLTGANLSSAKLIRADLAEAILTGANLIRADLTGAILTGVMLTGADLSGAKLSGAKLPRADLPGAKLPRADLSGANLPGADLSGADLSGANLSGAKLPRAKLPGADLSGADLSGANLSGADLSKARLGKATYTNTTQFPGWLVPLIALSDNDGDKVQFLRGFVALEKPEDEDDK